MDITGRLASSRVKERTDALRRLDALLQEESQGEDWQEVADALVTLLHEERRSTTTTAPARLLQGLVLLRKISERQASTWAPSFVDGVMKSLLDMSRRIKGDSRARMVSELVRTLRALVGLREVTVGESAVGSALALATIIDPKDSGEFALLVSALVSAQDPLVGFDHYVDFFGSLFLSEESWTRSHKTQFVAAFLYFVMECLASRVKPVSELLARVVSVVWLLKEERNCRREIFALMRIHLLLVHRHLVPPCDYVGMMKEYAMEMLGRAVSLVGMAPLPSELLQAKFAPSDNSWTALSTLSFTSKICHESVLRSLDMLRFVAAALQCRSLAQSSRVKRSRVEDEIEMMTELLHSPSATHESRSIKLQTLQVLVLLAEDGYPFHSNVYTDPLLTVLQSCVGDSDLNVQHWSLFALGAVLAQLPATSIDPNFAATLAEAAAFRVGVPILSEPSLYCLWILHRHGIQLEWDTLLQTVAKNGLPCVSSSPSGLALITSLGAKTWHPRRCFALLFESCSESLRSSKTVTTLSPALLAKALLTLDGADHNVARCCCHDRNFSYSEEWLIEARIAHLARQPTLGHYDIDTKASGKGAPVGVAVDFCSRLITMASSDVASAFALGLGLEIMRQDFYSPSSINLQPTLQQADQLLVAVQRTGTPVDVLCDYLVSPALCICFPWRVTKDAVSFPDGYAPQESVSRLYNHLWDHVCANSPQHSSVRSDDGFGFSMTRSRAPRGLQLCAVGLEDLDVKSICAAQRKSAWQFVLCELPSASALVERIRDEGLKPLHGVAVATFLSHIVSRLSTYDLEMCATAVSDLAAAHGLQPWTRRSVVQFIDALSPYIAHGRLDPTQTWVLNLWRKELLKWPSRLAIGESLGHNVNDIDGFALMCFQDANFLVSAYSNYFSAHMPSRSASALLSSMISATLTENVSTERAIACALVCRKAAIMHPQAALVALRGLVKLWSLARDCVAMVWSELASHHDSALHDDLIRYIAHDLSLEDWPFPLFNASSVREFAQQHLPIIIAELLLHRRKEVLSQVLALTEADPDVILSDELVITRVLGCAPRTEISKHMDRFRRVTGDFDDLLRNCLVAAVVTQLQACSCFGRLATLLGVGVPTSLTKVDTDETLATTKSPEEALDCVKVLVSACGWVDLTSFVQDDSVAPLLFRQVTCAVQTAVVASKQTRLLSLLACLIAAHTKPLSSLASMVICHDLATLAHDTKISERCVEIVTHFAPRLVPELTAAFCTQHLAISSTSTILEVVHRHTSFAEVDIHARIWPLLSTTESYSDGTFTDLIQLFELFDAFPPGFLGRYLPSLLPKLPDAHELHLRRLAALLLRRKNKLLTDQNDKLALCRLLAELTLIIPEYVTFSGTDSVRHEDTFVDYLSRGLWSALFTTDLSLGLATAQALSLLVKSGPYTQELLEAHPELSVLRTSLATLPWDLSEDGISAEWMETSQGSVAWLTNLCGAYLIRTADPSFRALYAVAKSSSTVAASLLPFALLKFAEEHMTDMESSPQNTQDEVGDKVDTLLKSDVSEDIKRDILSLIVGMRYAKTEAFSKFDLHDWFHVDFLHAARTALRLGQGLLAVNLLEVSRELDGFAVDDAYNSILAAAFQSIADNDARSGVPLRLSNNPREIFTELSLEGQWMKRLQLTESFPTALTEAKLHEALVTSGFVSLASQFNTSKSAGNGETAAAWRLSAWMEQEEGNSRPSAQGAINLTPLLSERDEMAFATMLDEQLSAEATQLFACENVLDFDRHHHNAVLLASFTSPSVNLNRLTFSLAESISFAAVVRDEHRLVSEPSTQAVSQVCTRLLEHGQFCLQRGQIMSASVGLKHFDLIKQLGDIGDNANVATAEVLWAYKEGRMAIRLLQECSQRVGEQQLGPRVFTDLGRWSATLRLSQPEAIVSDFYTVAVGMGERISYKDMSSTHHAFAGYCDAQFKSQQAVADTDLTERVRSVKLDELRACEELLARAKPGSSKNGLENQRRKIKMQIEQDNAEEEAKTTRARHFLRLAVEHYLGSLRAGDAHDVDVFRLSSLWLANATVEELSDLMLHGNVPSYKFVHLMHQLAARLQADSSRFQVALSALLAQVLRDHPFHSLYHVICIRNSSVVHQRAATASEMSRLKASDALLRQAAKLHPNLTTETERLCEAYKNLADSPGPTREQMSTSKSFPVDASLKIRGIKNISIPVATIAIPVRADKKYDQVPRIQAFEHKYRVAGGVNLPKIIMCLGSDGQRYRQLVKGNDDLRQDAVMQNVFALVNILFRNNYDTRSRRLLMRSYKVIPLSPRHGVLEWVENTRPLGEFILDLHSRIHPEDLTPHDCRKMMAEEQQQRQSTAESKLRVYRAIAKRFRPVFRFFFFEHYPDPVQWYEMRRNYTRSVAVSSMVGHVLGLGDRHPQNILIDLTTAEAVHIDLGIAFGLGKLLPTPERVPFRLTRDMVDGMGVTGVEGTFRRTSETTLHTLSEHRDYVMAILDVLRHDPLYQWQLSPIKMRKMHGLASLDSEDTSDGAAGRGTNVEAERALKNVAQCLDATLSAECRVNELTQAAQDERNLAQMFHGWQPWC